MFPVYFDYFPSNIAVFTEFEKDHYSNKADPYYFCLAFFFSVHQKVLDCRTAVQQLLRRFPEDCKHTIKFVKIRSAVCRMSLLSRKNGVRSHVPLQGGNPAKQSDTTQHALRERRHTHKVFTKDQYFYLNYHKFSIKSYVVDVY